MAHRALPNSIAFAALLLTGTPAAAQFPDKFTNLKVLPKDISKREPESTMRRFAFALGVRCDHCHVEKKAPEKGLDFPADDKDAKKTARVMLQMVAATTTTSAKWSRRRPAARRSRCSASPATTA
jgi:hypothetical protein